MDECREVRNARGEVAVEAFGGSLQGRGDIPRLLADGQNIHHYRRKKSHPPQCRREAGAFADHGSSFCEKVFEKNIHRCCGHEVEALKKRDTI